MKTSILLLLGLTVIVPCSVFAAKTYDQLLKVDKKAQSITLYQGAHNKTYTVSSSTRILINNHHGSFAGLKPGMKLSVTHPNASTTVDFINAESPVRRHHHHHA